ncbi:MAG: hypothetical protein P4L59_05185 [Desulfosporosinus sp.]|nr:hypothetical protein [Desulfosporosinus sp.]
MNDRFNERSFLVPDTEKRLFHLLASMGIMFGGQIQAHQILHRVSKTARKILAKLKSEHKVVEHTLTAGGKEYKLYTLGPVGAAIINVPYQQDYWFWYSDSEAIQKLMSVDLYIQMCDYLSAEVKVLVANRPYAHTFVHGDREYQIGVVLDDVVSLLELYRWEPPRERVILICQRVNQVDSLLGYLGDQNPVRIVTREKLKEGLIFYKPENGKWTLDVPDKGIKSNKVKLKE